VQRRRLLGGIGLAATGLTAGCFGWSDPFTSPGGSVVVWNNDTTAHSLSVTVSDGDATAFSDEFSVGAGENREYEDAFGGGEYDAAVVLDGDARKTHNLNVGSCSGIRLLVDIDESGEWTLSQGYCD
jgi:hypothetical protein